MGKIKVLPFNSLPMEERQKIIYYINEGKILTLEQIKHKLKPFIGAKQSSIIAEWIASQRAWNKANYELVESEGESCQDNQS